MPHLQAWRLRRALTQQALASLSGVSVSTINRLERDPHTANCEATTVGKLATALKVDPQVLLEASADGTPPASPPGG